MHRRASSAVVASSTSYPARRRRDCSRCAIPGSSSRMRIVPPASVVSAMRVPVADPAEAVDQPGPLEVAVDQAGVPVVVLGQEDRQRVLVGHTFAPSLPFAETDGPTGSRPGLPAAGAGSET